MSERSADFIIGGYGYAAGGEYGSVKINGYGKITGDIKCNDMHINGAGDAAGSVDCNLLRINGSATIDGALHASDLTVNGSGTFRGAAQCGSATVTGSANFKGGLSAQFVKVSGSIDVDGDLSAERFNSSGTFDVSGLLSADHLEVYLDWNRSHASEVGGTDIAVHRGTRGTLRSLFTHAAAFEAGTIEGNEITLELTKADVVRGHNVTLGDGCEIGLVEYTGMLRKQGDARVREEKKV
jgi:cytoskeletal protein CcmA (bactofilin family)